METAKQPHPDNTERKRGTFVVGEQVLAIRKLRLLTQQQLASKTGLSKRTIENLEKPGFKRIELDTKKRLTEALGVDADELCTETSTVSSPSDVLTQPERDVLKNPGTQAAISLRLERDFDSFTPAENDKFIKTLKALSEIGDVTVRGISKGSVIIDLELSGADALKIIDAFSGHKLDSLDITELFLVVATQKEQAEDFRGGTNSDEADSQVSELNLEPEGSQTASHERDKAKHARESHEAEGGGKPVFGMTEVRNVFEAIMRYGHDEDFTPQDDDNFSYTDVPADRQEEIEVLRRRVELVQPLYKSEGRVEYQSMFGPLSSCHDDENGDDGQSSTNRQ